MADGDEGVDRSPFTKPGFIVSALAVALVVVLGVGVVIGRTSDDGSGAAAGTTTERGSADAPATAVAGNGALATSATSTGGEGGGSICGLEGEVLGSADLDLAPAVDSWQYQGTMAYPISAVYGPAVTDASGYRYCFQHSPEGALYAAANAVAQADDTDESKVVSWLEYFLANSSGRDELMSQSAPPDSGDSDTSQGTRLQIAGYRMMSYDGATAMVDIALTGSVEGQEVNLSAVYGLRWESGDWKLVVDDPGAPVNFAQLPHLEGYIPWADSR